MKELQVIVLGTAGSGKSTVAELIARTLRENGIAAEVRDQLDDVVPKAALPDEHLWQRLRDLRARPQLGPLSITTQTRRITP